MSSKIPQPDQVLALLRARGDQGVHTFELRGGATGHFIGNPSQRIADLEDRGHVISRTRCKYRGDATGTRYALVHDADAHAMVVEDDDGQLRIGEAA